MARYGLGLGFQAVFSGPLVRSSYMADLVSEKRSGIVLNWILALASAALLILTFPKFSLVWLAPVALAPLLVSLAREPRWPRRFLLGWGAGVVYWFGVCYWIQFVLAFHGALGDPAGWAVFLVFCIAKAIHLGVFAVFAGYLMQRWWAIPTVAALWVAVESTHGALGFAWLTLGNAGIGMASRSGSRPSPVSTDSPSSSP